MLKKKRLQLKHQVIDILQDNILTKQQSLSVKQLQEQAARKITKQAKIYLRRKKKKLRR